MYILMYKPSGVSLEFFAPNKILGGKREMKKYAPLILVMVYPYIVVFALYCIFSGFLMESFFQNNVYLLLLYMFVFWLFALVCAISFLLFSHIRKWDAYEVSRINMIVKLAQIPAYLLIFLVGLMCLLTIFTFAISFILMALDGMTIILSGLIGLAAVVRNRSNDTLSQKTSLIHGILQFVFCADVVSSIIIFKNAKKIRQQRL